jgi:hypothetical protein
VADVQGWADKVSGYFVPVVVVLGVLVFCMWLVLTHLDCFPQEMYPPGSNGFLVSLLFAISVIVIGTAHRRLARTPHTSPTRALNFHANRADNSLPVRARPSDAHSDHGGNGSRRAERCAYQGRAAPGESAQDQRCFV